MAEQHDVTQQDLVVPDGDVALAVRIHRRAGAAGRQPAVVVMGSWLTVKEQMADTYARRLAEHGYWRSPSTSPVSVPGDTA